MFVTDRTDVIIDINGYFAPTSDAGLSFYSLAPCRMVDTRAANGTFGGPVIQGGGYRAFPLTSGSCGLPSNAQAFSLNATVVPFEALGYLTLWPAGGQMPIVSTLNSFDGSVVANAAIVMSSGSGSIDAFASNMANVILDVSGYFAR